MFPPTVHASSFYYYILNFKMYYVWIFSPLCFKSAHVCECEEVYIYIYISRNRISDLQFWVSQLILSAEILNLLLEQRETNLWFINSFSINVGVLYLFFLCSFLAVYVVTQPLHNEQKAIQGLFLSEIVLVYILCLPFPILVNLIGLENAVYHLPMTREKKRKGFMPIVKPLAWSETQIIGSRIWTHVTNPIVYYVRGKTSCILIFHWVFWFFSYIYIYIYIEEREMRERERERESVCVCDDLMKYVKWNPTGSHYKKYSNFSLRMWYTPE